MAQLVPIQLSDGTMIYIEAIEDTTVSSDPGTFADEEPEEQTRSGGKGLGDDIRRSTRIFGTPSLTPDQRFQQLQTTIRTYTAYTLNAFRNLAVAEVQKVSLEFGVNVSGVGGIPYIASGTMGCNLKITVECTFPDRVSGTTAPRPAQPNPNQPPLPPPPPGTPRSPTNP
ncbi:CU044_2847 family protein [Leptolyngbya sp. FACHB-711]|uniref:CU044_2847 family protein n=1 Tax=unclassified Leptolyngbya TaxID=2650499 RepID=UPI001687A848|nr:CU044_2847 family protein [Leptolyngbya sp. FACHB-711]MBD1849954.1 hypothetical protein [Cyanobacteria bacterium FACHB-502]MBD2024840.1 hypothetical protein [Leptolyngbya sp. FACHB-711]